MLKYGAKWPDEIDPLDIEFGVIRKGGTWTDSQGQKCGNGLFFHYREAQRLLWPTGEDHHRWSDLMLKTILEERITVCCGARDSGKTHVALSRFGLTDYFCFPDETLILMSSTDVRGLQLRVWGDVKDLHRRATELRPWLAGKAVDSKYGIFTDVLGEDCDTRDMRKGIICIPCLDRNYGWVGGLEKYVGIKQKRRLLLGDELQFMPEEYLGVLANLNKPSLYFKGVFVGNPTGQKALEKVAEPEEGYDCRPEPTKTESYRNKYGGITICLVGTDSPNFDTPPANLPYLIDPADEKIVAQQFGSDSEKYWSQIKGVRKVGLDFHRVLTKAICDRFGAFEKCIWQGSDTIKVFALDAAYGGDRAAGGHIEFGKEHTGHEIIKFFPPQVCQIAVSSAITPEEQLAIWSKEYCDREGIPATNVFFEAGMRATLAIWMAKAFNSTAVNAVLFGGNATPRPVSNDDYVLDEETHAKRHKRCDEEYSKLVTEYWFAVRRAIESSQVREFPKETAEEFYMREWYKVKGDRYELETKEDMKLRIGRSPDFADQAAIAVEGARRLGFVIERMRDPSESKQQDDDWLERELQKYQKQMKERELTYR